MAKVAPEPVSIPCPTAKLGNGDVVERKLMKYMGVDGRELATPCGIVEVTNLGARAASYECRRSNPGKCFFLDTMECGKVASGFGALAKLKK
jgi:hypothetical protein